MALILGLSACTGKNEEIPPVGDLDHAEQLIAGTYVGTWTRVNQTTGAEETATGSLTFSWDESLGNNVATVAPVSDGFTLGLKDTSCGCNVSRLSSGVLSYWNVYTLNPFKVDFTGKVSPEGVATMQFVVKVVVNRRETQMNYSFSGNKQ